MYDLIDPAELTPLARAALDHAASELENDTTGHDMHHVERVLSMARRIAEAEGADTEVVALIAALHDVEDFKKTGDELSGADEARRWLLTQGSNVLQADLVADDIAGISFKGAGTPTRPLTLEGECVQDADRLDALGAIGIARCFTYGGSKARTIHDPAVSVVEHSSTDRYLAHKGTSVTHFYEKLLLLKDRLNTDTAKKIAEGRHAFMEAYLEQLYAEWDGHA